MTLHRGTEIAEIAQIPQIPQVAEIAEVRLMGVIPDLVEADELIREGRGVLIAGGAGRHAGRRGRRRRLLRRVERLVQVRPGRRVMTAGIVQVIQGIEGVLHGGDRVDRDRGYRREGRAAVGVMIRPGLGRLLPGVVLDGLAAAVARPVSRQQHLRVLILMVLRVMMRQPLVQIADDRVRTDLGPVVVLMVGGHRVYRRPEAGADDRRSLIGPLCVLLHVLGQIGLLRVTLAAVLADVRLQVLRLLVLRYVLEQTRLVGEALVARVTLVRLVRLVASRMALQVAQLAERLRAARMPALVRLVAGVRADVLL